MMTEQNTFSHDTNALLNKLNVSKELMESLVDMINEEKECSWSIGYEAGYEWSVGYDACEDHPKS